MSVSNAKRRKQSANIIAARGTNPTAVLATDISARDNMRGGAIAAPRKVLVTARVSCKRQFSAPRIDMGEYSPVATLATELAKNSQDWTA